MYRASSHCIRNAGLLMRRVNPVELRIVSISRSAAHPAWFKKHRERDPCPKVEKPLPPLWLPNFYVVMSGLILAFTAGFIVYAKKNQEVRDWLSINMPWFDDFIAVVYEENYPLSTHASNFANAAKAYFDYVMSEEPEECKKGGVTPVPVSNPPPQPAITESDDDDDDDDNDDEDEEDECVIPPKPIISSDICKVEECLKDTYLDIIHHYMTVIAYSQYYNKIVHDSLITFSLKCLKFLKSQKKEREALNDEHIPKALEKIETFENLAKYADCGVKCPQERLNVTRQKIKDFKDQIKIVQIDYEQEYQRARKSDRWWKIVECMIDVYISETTALYPELNWFCKKPQIYGHYDLLLIHTKKYYDRINAEFKDVSDYFSGRVRRAYSLLPLPEKEKNDKLATALKKVKSDMDKDFSDRLANLKRTNEMILEKEKAEQLKHMEKIRIQRLTTKEKEMCKCAEKMVAEKIAAAKKDFSYQLNEMANNLKIVEGVLEKKCKADREQRRARDLYAASAALLAATKKGTKRVCVKKELAILEKNSTGDKLVTTVLNAIPYEVKVHGLVPESVIRDRYLSMESIAMKVSMIEATGAPLPMYAISLAQSMLLFMKPTTIPQAELDNPPKEPFKGLDTFDLLQRARYFMDRGCLATAVRYVDALEGASRGAAESWYRVANAHLQTRQAAEAILAHAAAMCLQYI